MVRSLWDLIISGGTWGFLPLPPVLSFPPVLTGEVDGNGGVTRTGPQLPTGAARLLGSPAYWMVAPGSGKLTSVPAAVEHPLPILAMNIFGPFRLLFPSFFWELIVTTAQFMYISRLPCSLNQLLRVSKSLTLAAGNERKLDYIGNTMQVGPLPWEHQSGWWSGNCQWSQALR